MDNILNETKIKMTAAIEHYKNELRNIRTGRANPGMVDGIQVEVYGTPMRLKDIASISTPEPRRILITPFDRQNTATIAKSIEKANLGFMPQIDAAGIYISIPQMTEEIRKKMIKICHDEREKVKVSIRNIRRDANDTARRQKADGTLAEDALKKIEKNVQEQTDKFCKEADELSEKKEKEISTI